jgi:hypothetical protein
MYLDGLTENVLKKNNFFFNYFKIQIRKVNLSKHIVLSGIETCGYKLVKHFEVRINC